MLRALFVSLWCLWVVPALAQTTWNASDKAATITLSGANLTAASATANSTWESVRSTNSPAKVGGKWHAEFTIVSSTEDQTWGIGIADGSATITGQHVGQTAHGIIFTSGTNPASKPEVVQNNAMVATYALTTATNDVIAMEIDISNGLIWFEDVTQSTGWTDSAGGFTGNPGAGTGGISITATPTSGIMLAFSGFNYGSGSPTVTLNATTATGTVSPGFHIWNSVLGKGSTSSLLQIGVSQ